MSLSSNGKDQAQIRLEIRDEFYVKILDIDFWIKSVFWSLRHTFLVLVVMASFLSHVLFVSDWQYFHCVLVTTNFFFFCVDGGGGGVLLCYPGWSQTPGCKRSSTLILPIAHAQINFCDNCALIGTYMFTHLSQGTLFSASRKTT